MSAVWYPLAISTLGEAEAEAVADVVRSGNTTMGASVAQFERQFAKYVGANHAVMVNSGSSADLLLALAMAELGYIKPGDEVLMPAVTWPTQMWAWCYAGCHVRLVDVNPITLNSDTARFAARIGPRTKVLSLVHLMGLPCELGPIQKLAQDNGLLVTEDCCEALGAEYHYKHVGGIGIGAAYSFFFSHQLSTMEGGMVTTNDEELCKVLMSMRSHGWTRPYSKDLYTFEHPGFNLRPTEVQGVLGLIQLGKLRLANQTRNANHFMFMQHQDEEVLHGPESVPLANPSWFGIPLVVDERAGFTREDFAKWCDSEGIETRPILGGNLARQSYTHAWGDPHLPGADVIHDRGIFLGLHPTLNNDIHKLAKMVAGWVSDHR